MSREEVPVRVLRLAADQFLFNSRTAAVGAQFDRIFAVVLDQGHVPGADGITELAGTPC
jgi:hypothetical protein